MPRKGICYIVGAAEADSIDFSPSENDLVIAADGGYAHLAKAGIKADIVVGDFDSLGKEPDHPCVVKLKVEKDETDLYKAAQIGLEKGYTRFMFFGASGGKLEHTIANIQLLNMLANKGCKGTIVGKGQNITVIKNSTLTLPARDSGRVSVFSLREMSFGVTLKGLKYPLNEYNMDNLFPIGVSNEFTGKEVSITVKDGELAVIYDA